MKGLSDYTFHLLSKRKLYFERVRAGRDRHALSRPHFSDPSHAFFDETYNLKANLVFWVLANNLKLKDKELHFLHSVFAEEPFLSSRKFLKVVKKRFAIKKITKLAKPLVSFSGAMRLELNYRLSRKSGKVKLFLKQTQVAEDFFRAQAARQLQREKNFFKESPGRKLVEQVRETFHGLVDQYASVLHAQAKAEADRVFLVDRKRHTLRKVAANVQMVMTGGLTRNH